MLGKSDLAQQVAQKTGLSSNKANQIINVILDTMSETLSRGDEIRLTGFGSFKVADTKERMGMNPRTRERIQVPASKRVSFSPGSHLNSSVRGEMGRKAA